LPLAVSAFSSVIAEKSLVKEVIVNAGTFTAALVGVDDVLLPHAARTRPAVAASAMMALFLVTSCK
jgi:hypothetical protein